MLLMAGMEQDLAQGYILKRNSYGQGDTPYQLLVRGLEADEVALNLNLSERTYTREEAHRVYEAIMEQLPGYILADNGSLKDVRSNLDLITSLNQYGVRLRWESESPHDRGAVAGRIRCIHRSKTAFAHRAGTGPQGLLKFTV